MFNVLIVEDHSLVAEAAMHKIQSSHPETSVVVSATAAEALQKLSDESRRWDLVLLDLGVPGAVGLSLAMEIRRMGLASRTCILTAADRPDDEACIAGSGFQGYLRKQGGSIALFEQDIQRIVRGERVFRITGATDSAHLPRLTIRQAELLAMAARGLTTKEIAKCLGRHPGTVERTINGAMVELGAGTRAQAVARALELGLIQSTAP